MAFTIKLFKFDKKVNSLKLPSADTASIELSCNIKTQSSIINPTAEVKENPIDYNYAYIEKFNRYYFINDITYGLGVWILSLNVDVLASFRNAILDSSQYVNRSASNYNRDIIDNIYPLKANHTATMVEALGNVIRNNDSSDIHPSYFTRAYSAGYFVISVISPNNTGISYYALSYLGFKNFINALMNYVPTDVDDVSDGVAKAFFDPIQYISSCFWYPEKPKGEATSSSINIGGYNINLSSAVWNVENNIETYSILINLPKHPNSNTYGYLNIEPYTYYNLIFEPFGTISIDSTKVYGSDRLKLEWLVDYGNGIGKLNIINNSNDVILDSVNANVGVNIPIAQITNDFIGGIGAGISSIGGLLSNAVMGDTLGAIGSVFSGIGSVTNAIKPMLSKTGTNGSFIIYESGKPKIVANFYYQVDKDPSHFGEPLCEYRTLNNLSGFCACNNATMETLMATGNEKEMIINYLNGGFYIE